MATNVPVTHGVLRTEGVVEQTLPTMLLYYGLFKLAERGIETRPDLCRALYLDLARRIEHGNHTAAETKQIADRAQAVVPAMLKAGAQVEATDMVLACCYFIAKLVDVGAIEAAHQAAGVAVTILIEAETDPGAGWGLKQKDALAAAGRMFDAARACGLYKILR